MIIVPSSRRINDHWQPIGRLPLVQGASKLWNIFYNLSVNMATDENAVGGMIFTCFA